MMTVVQEYTEMRRKNYLNGILTVNAALLTGLLWVQLAGQPVFSNTAAAQSSRDRSPVKVPNAASQRQKIIEELGKLSQSVEAMKRHVESGSLKVEVTNLDQIAK